MLFWHTAKNNQSLSLKSLKFGKLFLIGLVLFGFLAGLQPTLAIPPVRQSQVLAQAYAQDQTILSDSFSEAIILPHPGYISTHFSPWHPGVDIATGLGTPIRPILKGQVIGVDYGFWGLGHSVTILHEAGIVSTYGHIGKIYVRVGDNVTQSSQLGVVGLTGHTSGPHTHLEMTRDGSYINPEKLLPSMSDLPLLVYPVTKEVSVEPGLIEQQDNLPLADSLNKIELSTLR